MTKPKTIEPGDLICPECEAAGGSAKFADRRGLGVHRRAMHGVKGTAPSTLEYHKRQKAKSKLEKPAVAPKTALVPAARPTHVAVQSMPAEISVAMLGYAMGRLESLAEQIARENNLPEKEFVKQTAINLAKLVG